MLDGKVLRVEVETEVLQMMGQVGIISSVEHGRKREGHEI